MCDQLKIGDNQQNELKDSKEQEITNVNTVIIVLRNNSKIAINKGTLQRKKHGLKAWRKGWKGTAHKQEKL